MEKDKENVYNNNNKAHFTLGIRANVQLKSRTPIGAKVEFSPQGALH
jgi:hypothetical protein